MTDGPLREMTLNEWVDKLPLNHRARKELESARAVVEAARDLSLTDYDEKWRAKYIRLKDKVAAYDAAVKETK